MQMQMLNDSTHCHNEVEQDKNSINGSVGNNEWIKFDMTIFEFSVCIDEMEFYDQCWGSVLISCAFKFSQILRKSIENRNTLFNYQNYTRKSQSV